MPYINVRLLEGVTAAQKQRVIERITAVMVEELGKNPASTFVVIDEVPTDNWGHNGSSITELRRRQQATQAAVAPTAKAPKAPKAKAVKARSPASKSPASKSPASRSPARKAAKQPAPRRA